MPEISEKELPSQARPLWLKAINAVQVNNHDYAITLIQGVLEQSPGFLEGRKMLRKCALQLAGDSAGKKKGGLFGGGMSTFKIQGLLKKHQAEAALPLIEKELSKDPLNDQLNELLHEACLQLNFPETAAFALETVREHAPEKTKTLHKLASYYLTLDKPDLAVEVYNDIIKQTPTDGIAIKGSKDASARASMKKQNWSEGTDMRSLMRNVDQFEEMEKSSRTGLTAEQMIERRDKTIAKYNEDPNNLAVVKELAAIYEDMEDWANAHAFYDWAHSLSNGDVALARKAAAMNDQAIEQDLVNLEQAVQDDPDNEELRQALQSRRADRRAERVRECRERVEQNPTDPHLRFELGKVLYASGEYSDAIPHLQQATRNPHIRTKVLLTLARCFRAKNMFDLAVKQLSDALGDLHAMDGTKKEVLYEKGLIHEDMKDTKSALDCFKQIYEVDYGYRDVARRVESSYSQQ